MPNPSPKPPPAAESAPTRVPREQQRLDRALEWVRAQPDEPVPTANARP